jgi:hypothetical protein
MTVHEKRHAHDLQAPTDSGRHLSGLSKVLDGPEVQSIGGVDVRVEDTLTTLQTRSQYCGMLAWKPTEVLLCGWKADGNASSAWREGPSEPT